MFIDTRKGLLAGVFLGLMALFVSAGLTTERPVSAAVTTFEVALSGLNELPPVVGPGGGFARFTFDDVTHELTYAVTVSGLSPDQVTAAHIHRGAAGVNGPIVHFLSATGFTQVAGKIQLSDADVVDLKAGNFYANIHSVANPGGFARGQLYLNPETALRATVLGAVDAWNKHDAAKFVSYWTDNGIKGLVGADSVAEAREIIAQELGDPPLRFLSLSDVRVSDRNASATLELAFGTVVQRTRNTYVLDGNWKIDSETILPTLIPAGTPAVDFKMQEFAFVYDKAALSSGKFALVAENVGKQHHEAVIIKIPSGPALQPFIQELFESEDEDLPAGVDLVAFAGPYDPGTKTNIVFTDPLAPGRYALVCGIPDEVTGLPHAALGMISEFTVTGVSGGIKAPNTGDGGLVGSGTTRLNTVGALALAGMIVTASAGVLVVNRRGV